jgi:signal transduction histidine kinase/ligand-binding sensor domain-containing protein
VTDQRFSHSAARRCFLVLLLLASRAVLSADAGNIPLSHRHDEWDASSGFPGGYIYGITQTADGYLWIATSKGLLRYGGWGFTPIAANDSSGKFPVLGVVVDSHDALWAVDDHTYLFRYVSGRLERSQADNGQHLYVAAVTSKTNEGSLLFASKLQGLVAYGEGGPRTLVDPNMMPNRPTAAAQTGDGTYWIGTQEAGLFRISATSSGETVQQVAGLNNLTISCLLSIGSSTLLVGTDKGLFALQNGKLISERRPELNNRSILALTNGFDGDVWIGTDGQVFRANDREIEREGAIHSLDVLDVHKTVTALFVDRDDNLWIASPETIERYRNNGFRTYRTSAGLPCGNCGAIYVDHQDRLWLAPWDGGLFRITLGHLEPIEIAGVKDDTVYSIAGGAPNEVWIARQKGGVTRLLLSAGALQATTYTRQNGLALDAVDAVYRAPDGTVWAGTLGGGLSWLRGDTWRTFTTQDGLPSNIVSAITGNPETGEIFAGTPDGLGVFKNGHWTTYTARNGLPPGPIESLFLDDANTLWIGTTKGISFLQARTAHVPIGAPTPIYGEILGIAERNGWLWITTRDHVLRVRRSALLTKTFQQGDYREFVLADGLPSVEGVKRNRSIVEDDHGRLWFSLNKGISVLQPSVFTRPTFPVTTRLDGVLVDGRLIPSEDDLRIPPGGHRFTFRYAGVNASNPEGVSYRYHLDNVDSGWSEPTALREIDYTNIPPGRFQFHVIARNPDGIWSQQESTMKFEVEPEYWQTRWFQIGCVAALVLLGLGFYQFRLRQIHREFHAGLEARVNERTRIARELHDTLLQSFHGLLLHFQAASNLLPTRPDDAKKKLDAAINQASQAVIEGRGAVQGLRTSTEATNDLAVAIKTLGQQLSDSGNSAESPILDVAIEGPPRDLLPLVRDELYRIAGEALTNAFHHAQASRIEVELHYDAHQLRMRIRDDGKGIDSQVVKSDGRAGHFGLRGMRERAKIIGANLDLWSNAGSGTEVELTMPAAHAYDSQTSQRSSRPHGKEA